MPIPSQPPRLENVIGNQADVFTIPEETPEGTSALSYQSGWPARSATALSAGGIPPQREYFNAVNKLLSQHVFFQQSGSLYQWNNQNNYLQGAHILGSDGKEYVAVQASGPDSGGAQDPTQDTEGTYWTSAGSSVAAAGGGLEIGEDGKLYVAKLKTPRAIDGVNFDGSEPVTRFAQCSTAAGTVAKAITVDNFTLVEGATIMVLFNNTNTASNPTLNVSNTGAHPIQWRKQGVSPEWLAANRLYALTYTGSAWQIQGDITEACIQEGGGLSVDEDGKLFVDFDSMPTDKFEAMLKSIRVPIWLEANKAFYVNQATGSDTLDTGRGESEDKPFKTIQTCINYITDNYNMSRYVATIYCKDVVTTSQVTLPNFSRTTGRIDITKSSDCISDYGLEINYAPTESSSALSCVGGDYRLNHIKIDVTDENYVSGSSHWGAVEIDSYLASVNFYNNIHITAHRTKSTTFAGAWALYVASGRAYIGSGCTIIGDALENLSLYGIYVGGEMRYDDPSNVNLVISGSFGSGGIINVVGNFSINGVYMRDIDASGVIQTTYKYRIINGGGCNVRGKGPDFFGSLGTEYVESDTYSWYK